MNTKHYIQSVLFLPLILPLIGWAAVGFHLDVNSNLFSRAVGSLLASLFGGGIPYVIFLTGVLLWSRKKQGALRRFIYFAPLIYLMVFAIYWAILLILSEPWMTNSLAEWMANLAKSVGYFSLFILGFGYGYVAIGIAGYQLMRKMGWIKAT